MVHRVLVVTAALLVATPAAALAGQQKASQRAVTHEYQGPAGASTPAFDASQNECATSGCWELSTVKGEKTVSFAAKDATGRPVAFQVYTDRDYTGVQTMCGSGTLKVKPNRATPVSVRLVVSDGCAGVPTSGTITAVFSNR